MSVAQKPALLLPVSVTYRPPQALMLEGKGDLGLADLGLVTTATALYVKVTGCASGYTISSASNGTSATAITSGVVNLYKGDRTCLVKLTSLTVAGVVYNNTGTGAVDFTTWTPNSVATFAKTGSTGTAGDLIKVFVVTQVSSPVTTSDTISYAFTDILAGATNNVSQSAVSTAVPLSASGRESPKLSLAQARYLSTNADGSANMSFTVACSTNVTGSSGDYSCPNAADTSGLSGATTDNLATQISYLFIPDLYSACAGSPTALTVSQVNGFFSSPPNTTTVKTIAVGDSTHSGGGADGQLSAGAADNFANTISTGGYDTPSLITGNLAIYPSNLNGIFIIRRKNSGGDALSYVYQCVDIASITQS